MKRRVVFAAVIAACLSLAAVYAFGGRGSTSAAPAAPKSASIGVKVHGNWVVEVERDLPVPLGHRPRRPCDHRDIQPVE